MGLHKLTAGDGYAYLTRQVAAHDSTELGAPGQALASYYEQRGESPGQWFGTGLAGLDMPGGGEVTAAQMSALFGQGRHPNSEAIEAAVLASGGDVHAARRASALGRAFAVYSGASPFRVEVARRFSEHNVAAGKGWNEPIDGEVRARIRTEVGREMFAAAFGRAPADARELSGFVAVASRQATKSVAGFDLTFSPVKSVSALWALAPAAVVERIEAAHRAAVADTIGWIEKQVAYTRTGKAGVRQVDTRGLIAAAFTHRDSRAGDPDLHTHVAVSNKVQAADGAWLALDARVLYKAKVAASERYNTRLEAELVDRLGVRFAPRREQDRRASSALPGAGDRRVVREIVGVDDRLIEFWSQRRAAIDHRRATLAATFQGEHGRPPTEVEALALAQQANLETRAAKHEPRTFGDQRATWHAQACDVLGNAEAVTGMLRQVAGQANTPSSSASPVSRRWIEQTARAVLAVVANDRATWQVWHVRAEAERHARAAQLPREVVDDAVGRIVATALGPRLSTRLGVEDPIVEPDLPGLRRADGSSVYQVAGATCYTSQTVLDAEQFLLEAARMGGGRGVSADDVLVAVAESAAHGLDLNPTQAQLVQELATSGARLQVAIAPAGSGKTTAVRVLARAWTTETHRREIPGRATVLGLAPSAAAAAELRSQIGGECDTLAKLVHAIAHPRSAPAWLHTIDDHTLVIVDEAAMAGTADLATVVSHVLSRGASVRLIGDDHQLASVSAGGILRDIADQVGVVTLSELRRFSNRAEAAATLALRAGDPAALGFYLDHARVHVGDLSTAADMAYQAWAADRVAGRDAILLAPTRELAVQLNARARTDRSATDHPSTDRVTGTVRLADGNHAGVGDLVITRRNNRMLTTSATDWVKNGDRWTITAITAKGDLTVRHRHTQRSTTLPSHYVVDHVDLGYATTIHTAQGVTADIAHTVATGTETRQLFYVAMTRGRHANHVYLATVSDGEEHNIIRRETVLPPTATDILTAILARDERQQSATSYVTTAADPATQLHEAVLRYHDAVGVAAEHVLGPDALAHVDRTAELLHPGLTGYPAYPTLRAHLSLLSVDTATPAHRLLRDAYTARELDTALDPAAVLDWRLPHPTGTGTLSAAAPAGDGGCVEPLPWLPAIPAALHQHPQWGDYLSRRAARVAALTDQVKTRAADWTALSAPAWARHLLDPADTDLRQELAVWRAAYAVPDTDRHPTGPVQLAVTARAHQSTLDRRAALVLGDPATASTQWTDLARRVEPRILDDPLWPQISDHLDAAHRTGIPVERLLIAAASERPLPDDQPAAALWWRIAGHLSPAAVTATERSGAATLRPDWTPQLVDTLGPDRAAVVMSSPAWPALVAAVHTSTIDHRDTGWTPAALIATALDLALAAESSHQADNVAGDRTPAPGPDLADALVWHVAMLTDPAPVEDEPFPEERHTNDQPTTTDRPHAPTVPAQPASPPAAPAALPLPRDAGDMADAAGWAAQLEEHKWATAEVAKQRLLDLNQQALAFYTERFSGSWAAPYLRERLGLDPAGGGRDTDAIARYGIGYAPNGWTSLTDHLRAVGASERELVVAGLARTTRTGRIIDTFRDRMMFGIYRGGDLVGFIGRRNPDRDPDDHRAGPKYLNTAQTDLCDKGGQLFGLAEATTELSSGAVPVLVEGPLDAIAITLAGKGDYVGLAPLGTALTDTQTDQLKPYLTAGVVVATDADPAGQRAAERAYWRLVAYRANPGQLVLPTGQDPADLLRKTGIDDLHNRLTHTRPLAHALLDSLATGPTEVDAVQRAAQIIAALPPEQWEATICHAATGLDASTPTLQRWVIHDAEQWTRDPQRAAEQALRTAGSPHRSRGRTSVASSGPESRARRDDGGVPTLPVLPDMQRRRADSPAKARDSGVEWSR